MLAFSLLPLQVEAEVRGPFPAPAEPLPQVLAQYEPPAPSGAGTGRPAPARDQDPKAEAADALQPDAPPSLASRVADGAAVGVDLLLARPLLAAATAVGSVLFLPVAAVSAPQGRHGIQEAWEILVSVPFENTFRRPLGEF